MELDIDIVDVVKAYGVMVRKNPYRRMNITDMSEILFELLDTLKGYDDMAICLKVLIMNHSSVQNEFDERYPDR